MDPEILPGFGSGTRKIQSWIQNRNKSFRIHNTANRIAEQIKLTASAQSLPVTMTPAPFVIFIIISNLFFQRVIECSPERTAFSCKKCGAEFHQQEDFITHHRAAERLRQCPTVMSSQRSPPSTSPFPTIGTSAVSNNRVEPSSPVSQLLTIDASDSSPVIFHMSRPDEVIASPTTSPEYVLHSSSSSLSSSPSPPRSQPSRPVTVQEVTLDIEEEVVVEVEAEFSNDQEAGSNVSSQSLIITNFGTADSLSDIAELESDVEDSEDVRVMSGGAQYSNNAVLKLKPLQSLVDPGIIPLDVESLVIVQDSPASPLPRPGSAKYSPDSPTESPPKLTDRITSLEGIRSPLTLPEEASFEVAFEDLAASPSTCQQLEAASSSASILRVASPHPEATADSARGTCPPASPPLEAATAIVPTCQLASQALNIRPVGVSRVESVAADNNNRSAVEAAKSPSPPANTAHRTTTVSSETSGTSNYSLPEHLLLSISNADPDPVFC